MKKIVVIIILLILSAILAAATDQINDFNQLMEYLKKGEQVRVVIHYGDCKLIAGNEEKSAPDAIGGMIIDTFEYFAPYSIGNEKAFLVFSQSNLINYGGFIYNYVKFKIYDDNSVKITAQYTDPTNFELEMDENFFSNINNGENEGAVYFYLLR